MPNDSVTRDVWRCNVRENLRQICLKDVCQLCFRCTLFSLCSSTSEDLSNFHPRSNVYRSVLCFQINISNWTPVRRWSRIRSLWNQCSNFNLLLWGFLLRLLMEVHSWRDFLGLCTWWVKYFICMCQYHIWSTYFYSPCSDSPHWLHQQIRGVLCQSSGLIIRIEKSLAGTFNML